MIRTRVFRVLGVSVVASLILLQLPSPSASAVSTDEDVVFVGSGWGHGVGMSQYGAYGMAVLGSSYTEILSHYYHGSTVQTVAAAPLWVNLERDFSSLTLTVADTGGSTGNPVAVSSPVGAATALSGATLAISTASPSGCAVTVTNPGEGGVVLTDPNCAFDFSWYGWATPGASPTTKVRIEGCTLADWNVSPTTFRPCEYARGQLHLRSGSDGLLDLSVELLLEDYVLGTSEMPYYWPAPAALQSQAVASRSYAHAKQLERGAPAANSCDGWCHVKDTTADQRYVGWGHGANGPWVAAVQATANQVVAHPLAPNGIVTAFFSSSSGGATENVEERFGGPARPYLVSVDDSPAINGTVTNPKASWQFAVPAEDVAAAVGLDILLSVEITATRSGSGSALTLEYGGVVGGEYTVVEKSGTWTRTTFGLYSEYISVAYEGPALEADEIFFYRDDGLFRYYNITEGAVLAAPLLEGDGYTSGWDSITAIDLDGDGQDEIFFYRDDGLFRYYDINDDGTLGAPIHAGAGYTSGWDAITAVDLDGDGQDEMFFYREDGLFRYYNVKPNGSLPLPMLAGSGYTTGWNAITAINLDGDGQDEMFFYRDDGLFRYYNINPNGSLPSPILAGTGYTTGWDAITAIDLDGDEQDEIFFYRDDGLFRYYNSNSNGTLGSPIKEGSNYSVGWDAITAIQLDVLID